MASGHLPHQV